MKYQFNYYALLWKGQMAGVGVSMIDFWPQEEDSDRRTRVDADSIPAVDSGCKRRMDDRPQRVLEGAEAVAATLVTLHMKSAVIGPPPPPPIPFVVDHPFFFCILSPQPESHLRLPVFAGHCLLPVAKNRP